MKEFFNGYLVRENSAFFGGDSGNVQAFNNKAKGSANEFF